MLFRVARPMKRKNSRSAYFVQRIPADVKGRVVGRRLAIPFGGRTKFFIATERSQAISFSLGTDDPAASEDLAGGKVQAAFTRPTHQGVLREERGVKELLPAVTSAAVPDYRLRRSCTGILSKVVDPRE